ncbi:kinase-like domain-containing protein [Rhizophagus clarus]|uniref:Kinase-like domain-containing protein n=1 Tax=Rhizophagus clarus TaxID=94130 RepID=A0A8H3R4G0_9GLOM|nr:kinase-like domain-containing protein [Rhizophagus clarus]
MSLCKKCNQTDENYKWCKVCNAKRFQQNFINWTSGNNDIDKIIQNSQLFANNPEKVLEWISYDRFYSIKYIAKGGFGEVYKANWIDGFITNWDIEKQNWKRICQNKDVALKSLYNSRNVTMEFLEEITLHHKIQDNFSIINIYGITQEPETKNYMIVLDYADNGSLRNYLDRYYNKLSWHTKLHDLWRIAYGLKKIHGEELIHRDLHIGNILYFSNYASITDMGLLISGLPPYHNLSHDKILAVKICQGLRPRFNIKVPQLIMDLIKKCLDADPLNRQTAGEIEFTLYKWWSWFDSQMELKKQIKEAEEINNNFLASKTIALSLSYETHSEAIYTSRLLDFNNLPEPKNSDDYYMQNDDIISKQFSESLQIDISLLDHI